MTAKTVGWTIGITLLCVVVLSAVATVLLGIADWAVGVFLPTRARQRASVCRIAAFPLVEGHWPESAGWVLPGALTLRERDVMPRLAEVTGTSRGRVLRRTPPWRPIFADVLTRE
jgi:hypothetical protein